DGTPCVLVFGLAKPLAVEAGENTLTLDRGLIGTLAFMAPEQAAGRHDQMAATADVYSLGVVLYLLLTGRLPHSPDGSTFDYQQRIIETDAPSCRKVNPRLDREIEALVRKALRRDAASRDQSAGGLARDIEHYLAGDALNARRLPLLSLLGRRMAQHGLAVTAALLAVVLALGGALSAYVQISRARTLAERLAQERNYALYASRFREAHRAFIDGDIGRAQSLLATCAPELRRWE